MLNSFHVVLAKFHFSPKLRGLCNENIFKRVECEADKISGFTWKW